MTKYNWTPSGRERFLESEQVIVSKTDLRGAITYANQTFCTLAGYTERELLGALHSIVRHPAMPRCVFKLLWDTIAEGNEVFAYVLNMAKGGDHYWVYAHVTPSFDDEGRIVAYHSNRRCPERRAIDTIEPIYALLLAEEAKYPDARKGLQAGYDLLVAYLSKNGVSYEEFASSL